ncbi:unnamed protein product [Amaranthus hypochondriacus]
MASIIMKKVMFGSLLFLIAFECISSRQLPVVDTGLQNQVFCINNDEESCIPLSKVIDFDNNKTCIGDQCIHQPTIPFSDSDDVTFLQNQQQYPQPDLEPYFDCVNKERELCMPTGNHGLSRQALFDKQGECLSKSHSACQTVYNKIISDFTKNKPCTEIYCIPQPTIQSEPKPEATIKDLNNVKEETIAVGDQIMNNTNELPPERTLMVDSKELKRAEVGKCLTKGNVCRIPFINAVNNSSYLIEDCCEGQFCDQYLINNVEFGQCCLQNDRTNCWLP